MEHWPQGYGRIVLDEVDSTMDEAARRAPDLTQPTWIMARRQNAGRGRLGRPWSQTEGNLAASLVLPVDEPAQAAVWRSFLAAVALADTFRRLGVPSKHVRTKWPNDVLLDGGKVAGILLESELAGDRVRQVTVGLGVNLAHAPEREPRAAFAPVSLRQKTGKDISPEAFLAQLANIYAGWEAQFQADSYPAIRMVWGDMAAHNKAMTIRTGSETVTGQFVELEHDGQLVLSTPTGLRMFAAGDISFDL